MTEESARINVKRILASGRAAIVADHGHACGVIDDFVTDLAPAVAEHTASSLYGILHQVIEGHDVAVTYWRIIERVLEAPLRAPDDGEYAMQPNLDRLVTVNAIASHYWAKHAVRPNEITGTTGD
jgi:hypothetical protein